MKSKNLLQLNSSDLIVTKSENTKYIKLYKLPLREEINRIYSLSLLEHSV